MYDHNAAPGGTSSSEPPGTPGASGISEGSGGSSGYWYPSEPASGVTTTELLEELRRYRASNARMRLQVQDDMGMGERDLQALRLVIAAEARGHRMRQSELARELGITASSVSTLVDRLIRLEYLERVVHPEDRRSVAILATQRAHAEVRETLRAMHERMRAAAERLAPEERSTVAMFLREINHALDRPVSSG